MNKSLVNSEKQFMDLFSKIDYNEIEQFLDIEFAFSDGKYQSDIDTDPTINENQDVSLDIYRKNDPDTFPNHYPCIVMWTIDSDFDRCTHWRIEVLEYIYLEDFES